MLVHGGLFAGLLIGQMSLHNTPAGPAAVALDLAMFRVETATPVPAADAAPSQPAEQRPKQTQETEPPPDAPPEPQQTEAVTPKPAPAPRPRPVAKKPVAAPPPPAREPVETKAQTPPEESEPEPVQTAMAATELRPAPDHGLIASLEDAYRAALRQAIEANKFYPKRASRLRREGSVIVDFTVDRDGRIHDVRVHRSSGTQMLDQAAVEAVKRLGRFQPIPPEIPRDLWSLQIPMDYQLL